jgi:transcriptional regulator with XRE-family HTH domain
MGLMASRGRQPNPGGAKITVGSDERAAIKKERERRGWRQEDLAAKIGVSPGTISNVESGRHPQMNRVKYAKLRAVLFHGREDIDEDEDGMRSLIDDLASMSAAQRALIREVVRSMRKPK